MKIKASIIFTKILLCTLFGSVFKLQAQISITKDITTYIDKMTFIILKDQELLKIQSNASDEILQVEYDDITKVISIVPLEDLSLYKDIIYLNFSTDKVNYRITINYGEETTKQIVLPPPFLGKEIINEKIAEKERRKKSFEKSLGYVINKYNAETLDSNNFVDFNLLDVINNDNTLYIFTEIDNRSTVEYEVENIKIEKDYIKTTSQQNYEIEDIIPYNIVDENYYSYMGKFISNSADNFSDYNNRFKVASKSQEIVIFIFSELTLFNEEKMIITFFEEKEGRELKMSLNNDIINNPIYLQNGVVTKKKNRKAFPDKKKNKYLGMSIGYYNNTFDIELGYYKHIKKSSFGYYLEGFFINNKTYVNTTLSDIGINGGFLLRKTLAGNIFGEILLGANYSLQTATLPISNNSNRMDFLLGGSSSLGLFKKISQRIYLGIGYCNRFFQKISYVSNNRRFVFSVKAYMNL